MLSKDDLKRIHAYLGLVQINGQAREVGALVADLARIQGIIEQMLNTPEVADESSKT